MVKIKSLNKGLETIMIKLGTKKKNGRPSFLASYARMII